MKKGIGCLIFIFVSHWSLGQMKYEYQSEGNVITLINANDSSVINIQREAKKRYHIYAREEELVVSSEKYGEWLVENISGDSLGAIFDGREEKILIDGNTYFQKKDMDRFTYFLGDQYAFYLDIEKERGRKWIILNNESNVSPMVRLITLYETVLTERRSSIRPVTTGLLFFAALLTVLNRR